MSKNTETPSQARGWIATLSADEYSQEYVEDKLSSYTYLGQLEKGKENGFLHWQVYIENDNPVKFSTLKNKFPTGHFEVRKGTKQGLKNYVSKDETSQGVVISNGEIDATENEQGKRNDLTALKFEIAFNKKTTARLLVEDKINNISQLRFAQAYENAVRSEQYRTVLRDVKANYLSGTTRVGKTYYLWQKYGDEAYIVSDYSHPFDEYNGERVLIFDDFYGQLPIAQMLRILDPYPLTLDARFQNKVACFNEVWITSNVGLEQQYRQDRWSSPEVGAAFDARFSTGGVYKMFKRGELKEVSK